MPRAAYLVDSDIIDVWRGQRAAIDYLDAIPGAWSLSAATALELVVGARNNREVAQLDKLIANYRTVPLTEEIGARAYGLLKQYSTSSGLRVIDSLIAATAIEHDCTLCTRNRKHYVMIIGLKLDTPAYT